MKASLRQSSWFLGLLAAVGCAATAVAPPRHAIAASELLDHIRYLADDKLEGRMTGEPGCEEAARYIVAQFHADGLEPGCANGSYLQPFLATSGRKVEPTTACDVGGRKLVLGHDFAVASDAGSASGEGELCFAGYGINSAEAKWLDYDGSDVDGKPVDFAGKVVVVLTGAPGRAKGEGDFLDTKPFGRLARARTKIETAFVRKAAGLILIQNPLELKEQAETLPEWGSDHGGGLSLATVYVTASAGREMFKAAGLDLDQTAAQLDAGRHSTRKLGTLRASLRVDTTPIKRPTANVIGILRGVGPHADECLIVGAHYDHLGFGNSSSLAPGVKAIHHGADDNASGTAAVLEIAQFCATSPHPPPRTLVFLCFSGEELGLLGSQHYVAHPVIALDKTIAMLNLDMVGRSENGYCAVGAVGSSPAFQGLADRANEAQHLGLKLQFSDTGMAAGSSDHQSFLDAKVPSLFFFSGLHADYHKPSDTADKINSEGAANIARLVVGVLEDLEPIEPKPEFVAAAPTNPHMGVVPTPGERPWFGSIPSFGASGEGVLFDGVSQGSPAQKVGMQKGDRLIEWNGQPVKTLEDFTAYLSAAKVGDTIHVVLLRGDKRVEYDVPLAIRP